jgi:hypothetical protein
MPPRMKEIAPRHFYPPNPFCFKEFEVAFSVCHENAVEQA